MHLSHIKAIVFDLEGTLLDRVKSREKFIEEQFERFHDYFVHVQLADFKNKFIELDAVSYTHLTLPTTPYV